MRRAKLVAATAVPVAMACATGTAAAGTAHADRAPAPPYIDHTQWVQVGGLSSLRVYPTPAGRHASTDFVKPDEAWSEVLSMSPDADTPGMRQQFVCHWDFAEAADPGKPSWNLEPWRPVVDDATMVQSGCNPGGGQGPS
jgi:Protein of unknown function (DUF2599)/RIP homotypic interaction motif